MDYVSGATDYASAFTAAPATFHRHFRGEGYRMNAKNTGALHAVRDKAAFPKMR